MGERGNWQLRRSERDDINSAPPHCFSGILKECRRTRPVNADGACKVPSRLSTRYLARSHGVSGGPALSVPFTNLRLSSHQTTIKRTAYGMLSHIKYSMAENIALPFFSA